MVASKHVSKIIIAVMAAAVILCFLAVGYASDLTELIGGLGVRMEYETALFNTDEVISVDISMDEDEWNKMLQNATSEEYYVCDVVINGKTVKNVAIRPKGNTSLSAIAMDRDTNRFSFKLEFDHYVKGQTIYGLDKLILNNNYADATNMKEAVIYDMYQYLGADASLYNYAKVSVNGEYWGVYLALEAVEESFMLRNYGTQDGDLYKPDSMEMGGGSDSSSDSKTPDVAPGGFDMPNQGGTPPSGDGDFGGGAGSSGNMPDTSGNPGGMQGGSGSSGNMPDTSGNPGGMQGGTGSSGDTPDTSGTPGGMPGGSGSSGNMPDTSGNPGGMQGGSGSSGDTPDTSGSPGGMPSGSFDPNDMPDMGNMNPSGKGGFSRSGGADLNYSDDELDSYSTIWDGEITDSGKADHKRVVTALKNISEGNELEKYLDVDNVLKYMAVHTFSVNMDSLSGTMAHNYYLYEYKGQLNIIPWDYNLSFGGMSSVGNSSGASDMINDAIDTPFSATDFFDALLENEEYLERYHEYLQMLVDEYVNGGRFDEVYNSIRSRIDSLVETDPTAFYSYEQYLTAADMLYTTVKKRAESIDGQLKGTIPSTDAGQRQDSSNLIDASDIDVEVMGQFDMGGSSSRVDFKDDENNEDNEDTELPSSSDMPDFGGTGEMPDFGGMGQMPDFGGSGFGGSGFGGMPGRTENNSSVSNIVVFAACFALITAALVAVSCIKRKRH